MAPLIAAQLALGLLSERIEERELARLLLVVHFKLGIALLVLLAVRIGWRLHAGSRSHAGLGIGWRWRAATAVHLALYLLLLLLPASGYVIWVWMDAPRELFGNLQSPALFTPPLHDESGRALAWYIHVCGAYALIVLISTHIGAAVWHSRCVRRAAAGAR
jgi:cytochrome b561